MRLRRTLRPSADSPCCSKSKTLRHDTVQPPRPELYVIQLTKSKRSRKPNSSNSFFFSTDLVNGIAYSSGLGGRTESCLSVLDLEQQGLSDDALKVVLDLIFRPAQPREVEKKN